MNLIVEDGNVSGYEINQEGECKWKSSKADRKREF